MGPEENSKRWAARKEMEGIVMVTSVRRVREGAAETRGLSLI